jgi:hypothetical protein
MKTAAKAIARTAGHEDAVYHFAGIALVSLFPALFWTLAVAGIGSAVGHTPSTMALIAFGTAIAAFCGAIFQALVTQR